MFEHSCSMEQLVAALPEHQSQLLIVAGHDLGREGLLGQGHEPVDVLDSFVGLLPQLHLDGSVQLSQPRVQVPLLGLRVVQVDRVVVGGALLLDDQVQVVPQLVTQLPTGEIDLLSKL